MKEFILSVNKQILWIEIQIAGISIQYFQDTNKLDKIPNSQLNVDDSNTQDQLNDEIKSSSIKLSTIYWSNIFEFIKLINKYWADAFNTSTTNSVTISDN